MAEQAEDEPPPSTNPDLVWLIDEGYTTFDGLFRLLSFLLQELDRPDGA